MSLKGRTYKSQPMLKKSMSGPGPACAQELEELEEHELLEVDSESEAESSFVTWGGRGGGCSSCELVTAARAGGIKYMVALCLLNVAWFSRRLKHVHIWQTKAPSGFNLKIPLCASSEVSALYRQSKSSMVMPPPNELINSNLSVSCRVRLPICLLCTSRSW